MLCTKVMSDVLLLWVWVLLALLGLPLSCLLLLGLHRHLQRLQRHHTHWHQLCMVLRGRRENAEWESPEWLLMPIRLLCIAWVEIEWWEGRGVLHCCWYILILRWMRWRRERGQWCEELPWRRSRRLMIMRLVCAVIYLGIAIGE